MTRFIVFLIAAYVVYHLVKNQLKGNTTTETRKTRPEKVKNTIHARLKEIAYVFYSAAKDGHTCDACMALDGRHLLPGHKMLHTISPPHTGCKSARGCRCTLVYVTRDEEGGREIESFLRKNGGVCDKQTIERLFSPQ